MVRSEKFSELKKSSDKCKLLEYHYISKCKYTFNFKNIPLNHLVFLTIKPVDQTQKRILVNHHKKAKRL